MVKQNAVEAAGWLEKVKVADEANEATAQKQEMDANAAAAKETNKKDVRRSSRKIMTKSTTRLRLLLRRQKEQDRRYD